MLSLAIRNLLRRPFRSALTILGLAAAIAAFASLLALERGYSASLRTELDRMGMQLMLVPLGCPYDAAARVLKGNSLENTLPENALETVRQDPAVALAAPLLINAIPRPQEGRVDMWVGLDERALQLKPWWHICAGSGSFGSSSSVVLGSEAAEIEMRAPGDLFFEPLTGTRFQVSGVLERSGTSDDNLFFLPIVTAQKIFKQEGRLTAIAVRLRDPLLLRETSQRLQQIPGAQVVTITEMMGVFVNLVGAARTLMLGLALVAIAISVLSVFNTLFAAVVERTSELSVLRALGASSSQVLGLMSIEAGLLAATGVVVGLALLVAFGHPLEEAAKRFVPLAPKGQLLVLTASILWRSAALGLVVAILGGLYPAWRASRLSPALAVKET